MYRAPPGLRSQIRSALRREAGAAPAIARGPGWLAFAASILIAVAVGSSGTWLISGERQQSAIANEVIDSHLRSLLADHLTDVVSSDKHTVKPWFAGRTELSPPGVDLAAQGFPLVGGRLDLIAGKPVPALVYRAGKHVINVFVLPASPGGDHAETVTRRGYTLRHWSNGDLGYWAVTDASSDEFAKFEHAFRAAAVENILGFPQAFTPAAEVVTLAQNYRSTQQVLDVANALLAEAPRQHRKYLLSIRGQGARPRVVTVDELQTQAEYICNEVLRRREANVPLKRQAVLFRSSSHSDVLEVELGKRKVPFVKYGGLKFLEAAHVKDLLALLRWADNPRNTLAAFRALQLLPGMGPVNARAALTHVEAAGHAFAALKEFKPPQTGEIDWRRFTELMTTLGDPNGQWGGQLHLARGWYQPHCERLYPQFHTRLGDLEQLELLSGQYTSRERFLTELTLDPPNVTSDLSGRANLDEDYLVLSTIHSAKGMEWDTVYVLNVVDGSFPSEFSTGKAELIEEERRLLYVALTRAQNDLLLMVPLKFHLTHQPRQGDAHVYGGRSRFMTEKVQKTLDPVTFHGSAVGAADALQESQTPVTVDVGARLRDMW